MLDALLAACMAAYAPQQVDLLALPHEPIGAWMAESWKVRAVRGKQAPQATVLAADGAPFLRIAGQSRAAFFVHELPSPVPAEGSRLTISWRVMKAPEGADMRQDSADDSPLRVFVVFQTSRLFGRTPRTLFYSSGLAEPAAFSRRSAKSADLHVIRITESGNDSTWTTISVEPGADYARVWGGVVPCVVAVGLMQDTDATGSAAIADLRHLLWRSRGESTR